VDATGEQLTDRAEDDTDGDGDGDLLPLLWSASSPQVDMLELVQHWTVVEDRLYVTFVQPVPGTAGKRGLLHWTRHHHREAGSPTFGDLLDAAHGDLARGLRGEGYRTDDGDILSLHREGGLAAAAVLLPDFLDEMSGQLGGDRLVVGLPCPDELCVARADSPVADRVHELVQSSDYPDTELVPCVLSIDRSGIDLIAERR
jgi:hypothetical protein